MVKEKKISLLLGYGILLIFSCKNDTNIELEENLDHEAQNAVSVLKEFVQSVHPSSTRAGLDLKVTDIWSEQILVQRRADGSQTRTSILEADSAQIYTIKFRMNSQDGFALVSGREELPKLYAYVERGNLDDTLCIEGLRETLQAVRNLFAYDVVNIGVENSPIADFAIEDLIQVGPLTGLEWDQDAPYNDSIPLNCSNGNAPTGCVTTAIAMAVAYGESNKAMQENHVHQYNKVRHIFSGMSCAPDVAKLMYTIAVINGTKFGCDGSGTSLDNASKSLSHYMLIHQVDGWKPNWMKGCLDDSLPVITGGSTGKIAHAWLIDGGKKNSSGEYTHYYSNWGYSGYGNGFFATSDYYKFTNPTNGDITNYSKNRKYI